MKKRLIKYAEWIALVIGMIAVFLFVARFNITGQ